VLAAALVLRLLFVWETRDFTPINTPTPGLDVQVNWDGARALRGEIPNTPSFELMMLSAPLYPYWLAANQAVLGESMNVQRVASAVISSLRMALLFFVFLRLSRRAWAALAACAVLVALPSLIYFDTVLLKAATDITILSLLLAALLAWENPAGWARTLLRGLAVGALLACAFLSQLNTFLYALPVLAFAVANRRWPRARRALFTGVTLAIFCAVFAWFQLRSPGAAGDHARFLPRAGVDLRIGFQPGATGSYRQIPGISPWPYGHAFESRMGAEVATGQRMTWKESDRYFRNLAIDYVLDNPGDSARLVLRKLSYFVSDFEPRGTDYLYHIDDYSRVLRWSPFSFGWLFVLGALGLFALVARRRWRALILFGGLVLCVMFVNCLAIVEWRFRLPVVVLFAALAGPGLVYAAQLIQALRTRATRRRTWLQLGGLVALALVAGWLSFRRATPYPPEASMRRSAENAALSRGAKLAQRQLEEVDRKLTEKPDDRTLREQRIALLVKLRRHSEAYADLLWLRARGRGGPTMYVQLMRYLLWLDKYDDAGRLLEDLRRHGSSHYFAVRQSSGPLETRVIDLFVLPEGQRAGSPTGAPANGAPPGPRP